ncbi:GNAT family N-acetyltransferase [Paenibacillus sp. YPG26]|uniref:GNAT family N-acetyltransferase n=1 Tax=Paenibacillus sp. YPG26 TaxID=2878915 RepID=UPI00203E0A7B|nr:GNAT family N-acetyltransferase [Paenibacillus sp. YPG26]USB33006.1 GNAT family N-acetyltransferase [Paenibacillus sp. YPG26]
MLTIKRLHEVPMKLVLEAWERGFEGYYVDLSMPLQAFVARLTNEDLQLDLSSILLDGDKPIGINLNGIRSAKGRVTGWNGGIGIAPKYRGQGLGKLLMEESMKAYHEAGVHLATLEAFVQNKGAIKLYEKFGYAVKDKLLHMSSSDPVHLETESGMDSTLTTMTDMPIAASGLSFYNSTAAWQAQWQSAKGGQAIIVYLGGEPVGYAVYRQGYDPQGGLASIALYQCEVRPEQIGAQQIYKYMLGQVFDPGKGNARKVIVNLRASHTELVQVLRETGFAVGVELVYMEKVMNRV